MKENTPGLPDQFIWFWDSVPLQGGRSRATDYWMSRVPVTYFLHECLCTCPVTESTMNVNSKHSSIAALGSFSWNSRPISAVDYTALWVWLCVRLFQTALLVYVKENTISTPSVPLLDNSLACGFKRTCLRNIGRDCNSIFNSNDQKTLFTYLSLYIVALRDKESTSGYKSLH